MTTIRRLELTQPLTKAQQLMLVHFASRGGRLYGTATHRRVADRLEKLGLLETTDYAAGCLARITPAGREWLRGKGLLP